MARISRPSPAMIVACIALVVALGGTGYAALKLPAKSVGARQLKKGAVRSPQVRDRSLRAGDFAAGQLPRGAPGQAGPAGQQGPPGERGPSDAFADLALTVQITTPGFNPIGSVDVPAGSYVATSTVNVDNNAGAPVEVVCTLSIGGIGGSADSRTLQLAATPPNDRTDLALSTAGTISAPSAITLGCSQTVGATINVDVSRGQLTAVRVGSLQGAD